MNDLTSVFNRYTTEEGVPFFLLSKSVFFPQDDSLDLYDFAYADDDMAWTVVSYKLYGSISYWWVLSSLNRDMKFYAKRGEIVRYIKPERLEQVLQYV